jgi:hypothetical protein
VILVVNFSNSIYLTRVLEMLSSRFPNKILTAALGNRLAKLHSDKEPNVNFDTQELGSFEKVSRLHPSYFDLRTSKQFEDILVEKREIFLRLLERTDFITEDANVKTLFYRLIVSYWRNVLSINDVKLVIFDTTPHMPWDYGLYVACEQLNIKFISLYRTHFNNSVLLQDSIPIKSVGVWSGETSLVSEEIMIPNDSMFVNYAKKLNEDFLNSYTFVKSKWGKLFRAAKTLSKTFRFLIVYLLKNSLEASYYNLSRWQVFILILKSTVSQLRSFEFLESRALHEGDILPKKFVVFFLHYQPERSTFPEAVEFGDQLSAILHLRSTLGDEVALLVKEHPRQYRNLGRDFRQIRVRSKQFYQFLDSMKNVSLVSPSVKSDALISASLGAATLTGTALWEAVKMGKPGMHYGRNWLSDFEFAPFVLDVNDPVAYWREALETSAEEFKSALKQHLIRLSRNLVFSLDGSRVSDLNLESHQKMQSNLTNTLSYHIIQAEGLQ